MPIMHLPIPPRPDLQPPTGSRSPLDDELFSKSDILDFLNSSDAAKFDALPFGVIGMRKDGFVEVYNTAESLLSGLKPGGVIGRHFSRQVALCTNNATVSARFETEDTLDIEIDYMFAFRLAPAKVRLRMLKSQHSRLNFLLVKRHRR